MKLKERHPWLRKCTSSEHVLSTYGTVMVFPGMSSGSVSVESSLSFPEGVYHSIIYRFHFRKEKTWLSYLALFRLLLLCSRASSKGEVASSKSRQRAALPFSALKLTAAHHICQGCQDKPVCVPSSDVCTMLSYLVRTCRPAKTKSKACTRLCFSKQVEEGR